MIPKSVDCFLFVLALVVIMLFARVLTAMLVPVASAISIAHSNQSISRINATGECSDRIASVLALHSNSEQQPGRLRFSLQTRLKSNIRFCLFLFPFIMMSIQDRSNNSFPQ